MEAFCVWCDSSLGLCRDCSEDWLVKIADWYCISMPLILTYGPYIGRIRTHCIVAMAQNSATQKPLLCPHARPKSAPKRYMTLSNQPKATRSSSFPWYRFFLFFCARGIQTFKVQNVWIGAWVIYFWLHSSQLPVSCQVLRKISGPNFSPLVGAMYFFQSTWARQHIKGKEWKAVL